MQSKAGSVLPGVSVHPLGLCESATVGAGTRVWAFAHILPGAVVGSDCNVCDGAYIEGGAVVGDRVTVKNQVLIFEGVHIEDDVFLGPAMVFTNDLRPTGPHQARPRGAAAHDRPARRHSGRRGGGCLRDRHRRERLRRRRRDSRQGRSCARLHGGQPGPSHRLGLHLRRATAGRPDLRRLRPGFRARPGRTGHGRPAGNPLHPHHHWPADAVYITLRGTPKGRRPNRFRRVPGLRTAHDVAGSHPPSSVWASSAC